ncbi:uncharacterized protein [Amphiura filiformis]
MLQEKLDEIRKQKVEHHGQLVTLQESNRKERSKFISEVTAFSRSYDLGGKGQQERQADAKKHLNDLQKQQKQLETDNSVLGKQQTAITIEEEKQTVLQKEIEQLKAKLQSLTENHEKQVSKTKRLELAKMQVSNIPNADPEFQRLRSELESCQDDTMQGVCQALQQELDRLQRHRWQQQVQQQRQQPQQAQTKKVASLKPYQSSNNKQTSNMMRLPLGDQSFRANPPNTSSTNVQPTGGVMQSETPGKGGVGKFKPNLAKLRRSMEQQNQPQNSNVQQSQQPSTSSTSTNSGPPAAKQVKKVRFENAKWK